MLWLKKATNAQVTRDLNSHVILPEYLGYAERVYEKFVGGDKMVFVEGCKNPKVCDHPTQSRFKEVT